MPALFPASKGSSRPRPAPESAARGRRRGGQQGIALFMVLAAVSVLSIMVTEFTYLAQMNEKLAFDGVDQLKALYLAKSGLKLSLLRLKAYQIVKGQIKNMTGGGANASAMVPQSMINQIWSFPFMYPIPTSLPGLSISDKESIQKFQKSTNLEGSFSAIIESASSGYNINTILPSFAPSPSPSQNPQTPPGQQPVPNASPSPSPAGGGQYNAANAEQSLADYLASLVQTRSLQDDQFASEHRDFVINDFMDGLIAWADPTYQRKLNAQSDIYPVKQAPFYTLTELHMLPGMDDDLYNTFAPALTAGETQAIDINTMQAPTLQALVPQMTPQEVTEFFTFRDNPDVDNTFQKPDDFFTYLSNSVGAFKGNAAALSQLKSTLQQENVNLTVDESQFKITVQATVNSSVQKIEAWVMLYTPAGSPTGTGQPNGQPPGMPPTAAPQGPATNLGPGQTPETGDPGLRITYMKIS